MLARNIERDERGRVHRRQVTRRHVTDDDRLDSVDSVHADNLRTCHDSQLTPVGSRGCEKAPAEAPGFSRAGRPQDHQDPLAALQRLDSGS